MRPREMGLSVGTVPSRGAVPSEHQGCLQGAWLSLERADCHCLAIHCCLYLCSQLTVLPTLSAPARTFPVLPARSWSRLRHHTPTGRSIAGKRAQGRLGLMAPARQQKVGKVCCLGQLCRRIAARAQESCQGSPGTWGLECSPSEPAGAWAERNNTPFALPLISHLRWKQGCRHARDCTYY